MINHVKNDYAESYVEQTNVDKNYKDKDSKKTAEKAKPNETEEKTVSEKQVRKIKEAIAEVNQEGRMKRTACEFSYDDATNRIAIKVKDKETDEVIREIPAEETLEMLARIREQAGMVIDEKF